MTIVRDRIKVLAAAFGQSWWPVVVIAFLVGAILYQRWQFTHPSRPQVLTVGENLTAINLQTPQRQPVRLDWKADLRPTILYVFRPDCVWCARNLEAERAIAEKASGYHFFALSTTTDGLQDYLAKNDLKFPVYVAPDTGSLKQLKLSVTPETIIVSPEGTVQTVWLGAYVGENAKIVEKTLGVRLPVVQSD